MCCRMDVSSGTGKSVADHCSRQTSALVLLRLHKATGSVVWRPSCLLFKALKTRGGGGETLAGWRWGKAVETFPSRDNARRLRAHACLRPSACECACARMHMRCLRSPSL